jgi:hypothetical protein
MRYYFTDFFSWEQPRINQLRKEGKFVYSVIDDEGTHYLIARNQSVNRFGFLVTDENVIPVGEDYITDNEFIALNGTEDKWVMNLRDDKAAECAALQREYEKKQKAAMEEVRKRYA